MIIRQPTPTTFQFKQLFNLSAKYSETIGVVGISLAAYHEEVGFIFYYAQQFLRYCPFEEGSIAATPYKIHQNIEQLFVNTLYQSQVRKIEVKYHGGYYDIVAQVEKRNKQIEVQMRCRGETMDEMVINGEAFLDMVADNSNLDGSIQQNRIRLSDLPIVKGQISGDFSSSLFLNQISQRPVIPPYFLNNIHLLFTPQHYKLSQSICSLVQQQIIDCASQYSIFQLLLNSSFLHMLNHQQINHILPFIKTYKHQSEIKMHHVNQLYQAVRDMATHPVCQDIHHLEYLAILNDITTTQLQQLYQHYHQLRQNGLPFSRLFIECFDSTILIDRYPETVSIFLTELKHSQPQLSHYLVHKVAKCQGRKKYCQAMEYIVNSQQRITYEEKYKIVRWVVQHPSFPQCSLYFSGFAYKLHMKQQAIEILSRSSLNYYIHMDYITQVYGYCPALFIDFKRKLKKSPKLEQKVRNHLSKLGVIMQSYWNAI